MARRGRDRDRSGETSGARPSGRPSWVDKVGLLIALASVVVAIIALGGGSGSHGKGHSQLNLVDLNVRAVAENRRRYSRLEITLHNTGDQLVVIDGARFEIRRVYALPRCTTQGDLALSNDYGVSLPVDAKPGEAVEAPLHQQVGPDEADRFGITLSTSREQAVVYLFEVEASLANDGSRSPLPLGRVLVSLPERPGPGEYYWDEKTVELLVNWYDPGGEAHALWREAMPCWKSNTAVLRRALAGSAVRTPELDALAGELVTPTFAALE